VGGFLLPSYGMEVVYSRGADRLVQEMAEIRPAIMTAVPRLFEVLRARLLGALEKEKPIKRWLFDRALLRGQQRMAGASLGVIGGIEDALLEKLVREKVRARFGGALRALVSGGARLDPDLAAFFIALGLPVLQGYGQTEAGPVVSVNLPWANRHESVGMLLEGVVTNVANFGAFVDIGVHQDGLVHVSMLSNRFVKDPREVVKAGDVVKVKVLEVDLPRKRIALSMKLDAPVGEKRGEPGRGPNRGSAPAKSAPRAAGPAPSGALADALAKALKR
jgi:long-subunit acyl-CoA synthetase (AMP-forming)